MDAQDTHTGDNDPTKVFLIKVGNNSADLGNERFVIKFKLQNQLRSYFRLRADLTTSDSKVSPVIDAYKIKIG